ncbi:MAG: Kelch repeat-containing protein [Planctomycetota bacterium]
MKRLSWLAACLLASTCPAQYKGFWENRPRLGIARQELGGAVLGGKVYVGGGLDLSRNGLRSVEVFDPRTARWTRIADMPIALHHLGMCAVGGKLYQIGGYVGSSFSPTQMCHRYDPTANRWTRIADLPRARGAFVAVAIGGKIYAVGGVERQTFLTVVGRLTVYDPASNRWSTLAAMPTAREHLAAAAIGGKLYVAGGRIRGLLRNQLEVFDPTTGRWTTLAPMPTARGGNGASVLDGKLIVVGGEASRNFRETEEYDPVTNRWRRLRDMSVPLHGIYPVSLGKDLIVAGGGTRPGFAATNVVIAFRRLPSGVARYGTHTPACKGRILMSVTTGPVAGSGSFSFASSPNGPPGTGGVLALGGHQDLPGTVLLGFRLHVSLKAPLVLLPAATGASGEGRLALPIPPGTRGIRFFNQFVWANTPACRGNGPFSASDALDVTIQ